MEADIAVYVPLTEWEETKRGFNQSELLAREVAERLKLPLLPALVKTKDNGYKQIYYRNFHSGYRNPLRQATVLRS